MNIFIKAFFITILPLEIFSSSIDLNYNFRGNNISHSIDLNDDLNISGDKYDETYLPEGEYSIFTEYEILDENINLLNLNDDNSNFKDKEFIFDNDKELIIIKKDRYEKDLNFKIKPDSDALKNDMLNSKYSEDIQSFSINIQKNSTLLKSLNESEKAYKENFNYDFVNKDETVVVYDKNSNLKEKKLEFYVSKLLKRYSDSYFYEIVGDNKYFNIFIPEIEFDYIYINTNNNFKRLTIRYFDNDGNYAYKNVANYDVYQNYFGIDISNDISSHIASNNNEIILSKDFLKFLPEKFKDYKLMDIIIEQNNKYTDRDTPSIFFKKNINFEKLKEINTNNLKEKQFNKSVEKSFINYNFKLYDLDTNHLAVEIFSYDGNKTNKINIQTKDPRFVGIIDKDAFFFKREPTRLPRQLIKNFNYLEKLTGQIIYLRDDNYLNLPILSDQSIIFDFKFGLNLNNILDNNINFINQNNAFKILKKNLSINFNKGLEINNDKDFFLKINLNDLDYNYIKFNLIGNSPNSIDLDLFDSKGTYLKTVSSNQAIQKENFRSIDSLYIKTNNNFIDKKLFIKGIINFDDKSISINDILEEKNFYFFEELNAFQINYLMSKKIGLMYSMDLKVSNKNSCEYLIGSSQGLLTFCSNDDQIININNISNNDLRFDFFNTNFNFELVNIHLISYQNYESFIENINFFSLSKFSQLNDYNYKELNFITKKVIKNKNDINKFDYPKLFRSYTNLNLKSEPFEANLLDDFTKKNPFYELNKFSLNKIDTLTIEEFQKYNLFFEKYIERVDGGKVGKILKYDSTSSVQLIEVTTFKNLLRIMYYFFKNKVTLYLSLIIILFFVYLIIRKNSLLLKSKFLNLYRYLFNSFQNIFYLPLIKKFNRNLKINYIPYKTLSFNSLFLLLYLSLISIFLAFYINDKFNILMNVLYILLSINLSIYIYNQLRYQLNLIFFIFSSVLILDFIITSLGIMIFEVLFSVTELILLGSLFIFKLKKSI